MKILKCDIKQPEEELFMDYSGGLDYDNGLECVFVLTHNFSQIFIFICFKSSS